VQVNSKKQFLDMEISEINIEEDKSPDDLVEEIFGKKIAVALIA